MRTIGILIAIAAACGGAKPPQGSSPTTQTAPEPARAPFDQQFIDAMVPHHRYLIALAQVAKERATRPELQAFAEGLARTAQGEADRMIEWRRTWYGSGDVPDLVNVSAPDGVTAHDLRKGWATVEAAASVPAKPPKEARNGKGTPAEGTVAQAMPTGDPATWTPDQRIAALRAANVDVDRAFLEILTPLAEHGVDMARQAQTRAEKAELREFARALRDTQERTLAQARQWQDAWYREAPERMHVPAPTP
jgi:uncharacterized protein (DUF305 family)